MQHWRALIDLCQEKNISPSVVTKEQTEHGRITLRNTLIRELHEKHGVTVPHLAELTPMSVRRIQEIIYGVAHLMPNPTIGME